MAVDAHLVDVDEAIAVSQLFDGIFVVGERIVAQVAVAVVVVPLAARRMTATLTHADHYESCLSQTVGARCHASERIIGCLDLWSWIDIVDDRIDLGRIEVEWLVHGAPEVGDAIGCLDLEYLRELISLSLIHISEPTRPY